MSNFITSQASKQGRTNKQGRGVATARVVALVLAIIAATVPDAKAAESGDSQPAAKQVDQLLAKAVNTDAVSSATSDTVTTNANNTTIDDTTFLRRVYLDIIGTPPTPDEIATFLNNDQANKRQQTVDRLLRDPRYGQNWSHYWRDVILARRIDQRQLGQVTNSLGRYLTRVINNGRPWDKIARDFVTAEGNIRKQGDTSLIFLQQGKAAESASEISRIFLGIQISCAQCHDHPTDQWTREQFHEFAAFFPRIRVRAQKNGGMRTFNVVGQDRGPQKPKLNKKGKKRPPIEHFMPDLEDPAADGTQMTPKFFVNGKSLPLGTPDNERRESLATWIVEPANPWFARAYVNRMWAELVGWGFYEPIDDLGPERSADAQAALDYLTGEFVRRGHNMRWLVRTITATDAYQRPSRSRNPTGEKQLLASHAQPLRGDALFDSLAVALNLPFAPTKKGPAKKGNKQKPLPPLTPITDKGASDNGAGEGESMDSPEMEMEMAMPTNMARKGPRKLFQNTFGYDPSLMRGDVKGSIPQALAMMNAPQIQKQITAKRRRSLLRKIMAEHDDDASIVTQLYLYCLARPPSETELQTCLDYIDALDSHDEALEDLQWSLINSTEFRHRR